MKTDAQLLKEYVKDGSEHAFQELVERYGGLIYSAALRQVGNEELARDVMQAVFVILSKRAEQMAMKKNLASWLTKVTRYTAIDAWRAETARKKREAQAVELSANEADAVAQWEELAPHLDGALMRLGENDREVVLRRYFRNESVETICGELGLSGVAVRKRITRAVERLRAIFQKEGVPVSSALLPGILAANAVHSLPAAVTGMTAKAVLAGSSGISVALYAKGGMKMMFLAKVKAVAVTVLAVGVVGGGAVVAATNVVNKGSASASWPQWRGPTRDGIVHGGPKLLDSWPKEGPKLLWKSEPIPANCYITGDPAGGGVGSVVVSDGKAFVYVNSRQTKPKIAITADFLSELGWVDGVPDDLAKKVEEARTKRGDIEGEQLAAYIKDFMAKLEPAQAEKFGGFIRNRLSTVWDPDGRLVLKWNMFADLVKIKDKEFRSINDLAGSVGYMGGHGEPSARSLIGEKLISKFYDIKDVVICMDAATGKTIWKKEFPGVYTEGYPMMGWPAASGTPVIAGGKCYATGGAGVYCLDVKDGAEIWRAKAGYTSSSPLVYNGAVFFVDGGQSKNATLVAYDARNGKLLWRQSKVTGSLSSPILWNCGGKNYLIVHAGGGGPYCVDPDDGTIVWQVQKSGGFTSSTPVVDGDVMVVFDGSVRAFRITPEKAELLWENRLRLSDRGSSPLVYQDHIYLAGRAFIGGPVCLNLKTGDVKWEIREGSECSSLVVADGKMFREVNVDGVVGMFKATPDGYEELGKFSARMAHCSSPAIAGGKLYLRLQDAVACYDITHYGPYVDKTVVTKDKAIFVFKQAEGGLGVNDSSDGSIRDLTIVDASGVSKPAKAKIDGSSLVVDLNGVTFPLKIAYAASGNLGAKSGSASAFEWKTPRLQFRQCQGNTIVLQLDTPVDPEIWSAATTYSVSGAKVTKVEVDKSDGSVRLTTDRAWKTGEKVTIKYPASPADAPGVLSELVFTALPGRAVNEGLLKEYLMGELQEKIDVAKPYDKDTLDKNTKPVVGEKWKTYKDRLGDFDLRKHVGDLNNALIHACVYLHSDADCKVQLWVGSTGGMQVVLDGKVVQVVGPYCYVDGTKIKDVELKKGWNTVLLGIPPSCYGWNFCMRIKNEQGDGPPEGVRYATELTKEK